MNSQAVFIFTVVFYILATIEHSIFLLLQQKDGRLEKWWGKNAFPNLQLISGSFWLVSLFFIVLLQFQSHPQLPILHWLFLPLGGFLFIIGLILVLWSARLLGLSAMMGARFFPQQSTKVIRTGPYRFFTNPMYIGYNLIFLGLALCLNSLYDLMLLILSLVCFNLIEARIENKGIYK